MAITRFTKEHEWVRIEGDEGVIGITSYAQEQLGDLVYVEMPEKGLEITSGDQLAVVESVKAASEVYSPVSGTVTAINQAVVENPAQVNTDPLGEGWFCRLKLRDPDEVEGLMDEDGYAVYCEGLA
jgi:glycine cleavage system H protein